MLKRLAAAATVAILPMALASCVSRPPADMALRYTASKHEKGYVARLEFFTRAEMNDPEWEFARVMNATMRMCSAPLDFIARDVRWFPATQESGEECARVVYTIRCVPDEVWRKNPSEWPKPEDFRAHRDRLLNEPPGRIERGCGEKDRSRRPKIVPS